MSENNEKHIPLYKRITDCVGKECDAEKALKLYDSDGRPVLVCKDPDEDEDDD